MVSTLAVLAFPAALQAQPATLPVVHVGVVLDGPSERSQQVEAVFRQQITEFFGSEYDVRFEPSFAGDWTLGGVRDAASRAMSDPDVDIVLGLGVLASHHMARRADLRVPVIACFVVDAELQGLPRQNGTSGVRNLCYLDEHYSVQRTIEQFQGIVPFKRLAVLVGFGMLEALPQLHDLAEAALRARGASVEFIPVAHSATEALGRLPADADAVYVSPLPQLPPSEFAVLVAGVNERRLPSFSYIGRNEVEAGILAAYAPRDDVVRRARRVASNMHRILSGEDAGTIEVDFIRPAQLTLNMVTARTIGFYPTWPILTEAELVNAETDEGPTRTLASTVRDALQLNLSLMAAHKQEEAGREEVRKARAGLLPQIGASAAGTLTRPETAEASFGTQPERVLEGSIGLEQSLYSEQSWAGYSIERHLQEGRESELHTAELDVALETANAYLNVLRAGAAARIQRDNLRVSLSNLELARLRESIGASGRSDVYRWESQVATNRRNVLNASANVEITRIDVNRLLHRPLEEPFVAAEIAVTDTALITGQPRLFAHLGNPRTFAVFRDFMVQEGWDTSPELRQIDAAIAAQRRARTAARRAFWVPDVGLEAGIRRIFDRSGAGVSGALPPPFPEDALPPIPDLNWSVELGASLPIFTGFARHANAAQTRIDLDRLEREREALADVIGQRVRTALHQSSASFAGIEQARLAADAARQNLAIVTESYASGSASIITLLDAQNAALVSEQAAADAHYDFLLDLMQVERAIGRFFFLQNRKVQQSYFQRLEEFFRQAGIEAQR